MAQSESRRSCTGRPRFCEKPVSKKAMTRIFDITPMITEGIGVFPGDVAFRRHVSLDFAKGNNLLLSSIHTTLHLGAHADGPNHYAKDGVGIAARDPRIY